MFMRLTHIKLAGFKSFVDPTILELRSQLMAVVGPNGCGKSNIIDAIRWVMGESSAKNLRGESMADVIFNGSSSRKPVGQASVELVFDNSDGSLGGEYARFSQISVKRQGSRDGQSSYFLNGTRCRRKDITDIFLGTGIGPRSYAIIEQGMISRVIEAKPEELRSFIEEAAGVSLYRKRRHETEIRMRHTRENLDRLNDLRQELDKQLERLKRQSEAASKYKVYKEEQDKLEAELAALRWQVLNEQLQIKITEIRTLSNALEEKLALRANLDLELEKLRVVYTEKSDAWKKDQGHFYDIGTQIARIEQTIQHQRERAQSLELDLQQTEQNRQQMVEQIEEDEANLLMLTEELKSLQPACEEALLMSQDAGKVYQDAEEAMRNWTQRFEVFQIDAEKPQRTAEVEKARIEQLERQSREAKAQWDRIQKEQNDINVAQLENQLRQTEQELLTRESDGNGASNIVSAITTELNQERENLTQETKRLADLRNRQQSLQGRLASLEALQQAALGKTNAVVKHWLKTHGLADAPRLGETIKVDAGYEQALETVLGEALEAVCVNDMSSLFSALLNLKEGNLAFIHKAQSIDPNVAPSLNLLISKIKTDLPILPLLAGVFVANDLTEALGIQKNLKINESVVTQDGIWLGPNWLRVYRDKDAKRGILMRENELKEINVLVEQLKEEISNVELNAQHHHDQIKTLEAKRDTLHQAQQDENRLLKDLSSKVSAERAKLEHIRNRLTRLQSEALEQQQKLELAEEETSLARLNLQTALDAMEAFSQKRSSLQIERDKLRELLQRTSLDANQVKEKAHTLALQQQTVMTQIKALEEGLERSKRQQNHIFERQTTIKNQLVALKDPEQELRESLEDLLSQRIYAEDALTQSRTALDEIEQEFRTLEKRRNSLEDEAQNIRNDLEKYKLEWQAIEVRAQTVQEKIEQSGLTLEQILQSISKEANEPEWANELEQVTKRIERLGAINLAAIEEYQSEQERKNYLDSQHNDLTEALETLENAIRKIDKETRARFKETFDKVNEEFQTLFPRLFGGGQAVLELVGDDMLEAGVTVMARPPGKRNSSIHLLSGGEKALTAVAMVFAIFQLNPAPFCLLDEVDAPLDDANVGRFCDLVKRLSNSVQFIVVTHNKLAMEIAHHLVGVTMKEPGVSRLVSVDVEEAAALVAS